MVRAAKKAKLKAIAFTEHVDRHSDWFDAFKKRIDGLKSNKDIRIYCGIESAVNDLKGTLKATRKMIHNSEIVVGVVHRYPDGNGGLTSLEEIRNFNAKKAAEIEFKLGLALLNNKYVDVLGHPFGIYCRLFNDFPEDYFEKILKESLKKEKVIEINTKYFLEKSRLFYLLKKINPYISIGSDAHSVGEIARSYNILKKKVKR